ncbi:MAG: hypothetical protein GXO25_03460 [Euryarchaeota archaeon]|nr:hypothetical protein [Euryarchaeota archaeon]
MVLKLKSGKISLWIVVFAVLATAFAGRATGTSGASVGQFRGTTVILIHNVYELQNMSKNLNATYELANDINATVTKTWNGGAGFVPVGSKDNQFNGTFDGNGHKIIGLFIDGTYSYPGLFGVTTKNATVKNLNLIDVVVVGSRDTRGLTRNDSRACKSATPVGSTWKIASDIAGAIVGVNYGNVTNSYVSGKVSDFMAGGIVGWNWGVVRNSKSMANVSSIGDDGASGGVVGVNYGFMEMDFSTGHISAEGNSTDAGGLVGDNEEKVIESYSECDVATNGTRSNGGGLVGFNNGIINNSYATGTIEVDGTWSDGGGLVGNNCGNVTNTYATGNVSAEWAPGGLIGENWGGDILYSFWDMESSGLKTSEGGTGKTTAEMMNKTTFLNAGWDFTNIWNIVDGKTYPFFRWQEPSKPSEPMYLHATIGKGYVNITWTNPSFDGASPITEYRIYRNGELLGVVPATQLWYNDTNVVTGQTYTYYVTAVNAAGESPKSNEVQATPGEVVPEFGTLIPVVVILMAMLVVLRRR